ncbi:MAG TPA: translocation/assembly module TamB domain-containing protein [Dissulfurispiraceae bacterium]|nr:translocation/assembly module TamB domain-containing protein [Dissulfurispiraceae bacterium]
MKRKLIYIATAVLLCGIFLYASRGPDISNALKRVILPELEDATGRKFIAQQIYVNLMPLFVEIKGLKSFDDNGEKILEVQRVKGYIGLSGLIRKKLLVKRLVIKEPELHTDRRQLEEISANIKQYLAKPTRIPIKLEIKSINVSDAALSYKDSDYRADQGGFDADVIINKDPEFIVSSRRVLFNKKGLHEAEGSLEATFFLRDTLVDLKKFKINSYKSGLSTSGSLETKSLIGRFQSEATVYINTVKKIFGLKRNGEGELTVKGTIGFDGLKSGAGTFFTDVKVKGDLFIETLMELLKVKERIAGHVSVDGFLKGPLDKLYGEGKLDLDKGDLFGVPVDKLDCKVLYHDGALKFLDGNARLLKGKANVEAMIRLPVVNYFEVKVNAEDVSSEGLLKLVGLQHILPEGKVSGTLTTAGSAFDPEGQFSYISTVAGPDVLGRVRSIKSGYTMKNGLLFFDQMFLATGQSKLYTTGSLDLKNSTLNFRGTGETGDIRDLSAPYFSSVSGPARFSDIVTGSVKDPVVDMHFDAHLSTFATKNLADVKLVNNHDFIFDSSEGDINYKKNRLTIKYFSAQSPGEKIRASGTVLLPQAVTLFDFKKPEFDLSLSLRNLDVKTLMGMFTGKVAMSGVLNTDFNLSGGLDAIKLSGDVHGSNITVANQYALNSVDGYVTYEGRSVRLKSVRLKRGSSALDISGTVGADKTFSIDATGKSIKVSDIVLQRHREKLETRYKELFEGGFFDTIFISNLNIRGTGTFENPIVTVKGDINTGPYRGRPVGSGYIEGFLKGKQATLTASLLNKKLIVKGEAQLTDSLPWKASADLQSARYDFIAASFMKDVPEDLLVNLKGNIMARGDKEHLSAVANINNIHVYLYGTGYTNSSGVGLKLENNKLSIGPLSLKSDTSEFRLSGSVSMGSRYDLLLEGSSSLSPLKALSKNIDVINGDASFVCSFTGEWNDPKINGDMEVYNGVLGFKNIRYRLSSVSAYLYFDEDRIVLDSASGKLSGGDVTASGAAYLQKFSINRFLLNTHLRDVTASVSKDFWVNFNADLNYGGTLASQTILGDVEIMRAKYTERVEWKSWLLGFRQKEKPKVESSRLDNTKLNVRVSGSNLSIDNNVAKASAKMDILLRGTIGQPAVLGKLEAKQGLVYFRNNEFKILQTTVDFSNPDKIMPYFAIVAQTKVRNYNIMLTLDGYVNQFTLSLSSDPFLAEADILSLLTVGQIGKNLRGLEGGIGAGEATSFLTGKMQDVFEERLRTITGLNRLSIEPSVTPMSEGALTTTAALSNTTGTVSPRVTVSKQLLGDKLYVTYSAATGSGEAQVVKLEYLLGPNVSLVGDRDELGSLGGDIKFRFGFK